MVNMENTVLKEVRVWFNDWLMVAANMGLVKDLCLVVQMQALLRAASGCANASPKGCVWL